MNNLPARISSGLDLTEAERIDLARLLGPLLESEPWKAYSALILKLRQEALEANVTDQTKDRAYYRGYIAAIDEIGAMLQLKVAEGQELLEKEAVPKPRIADPGAFKPGGGGFGWI